MSFERNLDTNAPVQSEGINKKVIEILQHGKPENEREAQIHLMYELWKRNRPSILIDVQNRADQETLAEYWVDEGYSSAFRLYITSGDFLEKTKNMTEAEKWQSVTLEDLNSQFTPINEDFE